eukprot:8082459-Alexandrium_andersonii.AAC.1
MTSPAVVEAETRIIEEYAQFLVGRGHCSQSASEAAGRPAGGTIREAYDLDPTDTPVEDLPFAALGIEEDSVPPTRTPTAAPEVLTPLVVSDADDAED